MAVKTSPSRLLIREDVRKVGKGALIAGFGAAAFYVLEALPSIDFGETATPIVVAACSVLTNVLWKWWRKNKYQV